MHWAMGAHFPDRCNEAGRGQRSNGSSIEDDQIDGRRQVFQARAQAPLGSRWSAIGLTRRPAGRSRASNVRWREDSRSRLDINSHRFKVGDVQVWMPVSGISVGYGSIVDHMPVFRGEPIVVESISVLDGTMEFNKGPGPDVFSVTHDLGPPISDRLRRLNSEFAKEKTLLRPTRAYIEKGRSSSSPTPSGSPLSWRFHRRDSTGGHSRFREPGYLSWLR